MPFFAPATIPQVTFHPYASSPRTPVETTTQYAHYDDLTAVKVQLRRMLKQNKIARLPAGFPFQCLPDAYGRYSISHASYDFQEYVNLSDHCSRPQYVTFKYVAPSSRAGLQEMEWRIVAPDRKPLRNSNALGTTISQVKLDPMVMETAFGLQFMTNSRIIQEALALSLELGILVTIQIATQKTQMMYPCRRGIYFSTGEIIFLATDNYGRSEVVFVYQP